jgi:hypothetical protein
MCNAIGSAKGKPHGSVAHAKCCMFVRAAPEGFGLCGMQRRALRHQIFVKRVAAVTASPSRKVAMTDSA